jgi:hypothetical protein
VRHQSLQDLGAAAPGGGDDDDDDDDDGSAARRRFDVIIVNPPWNDAPSASRIANLRRTRAATGACAMADTGASGGAPPQRPLFPHDRQRSRLSEHLPLDEVTRYKKE